jgi:hypothetical protein
MAEVIVQIGVFPGRLDAYGLEVGTTVAAALKIAGLTQGAEQDIKMDGEVVDGSATIDEDTKVIILSKRIKGAQE